MSEKYYKMTAEDEEAFRASALEQIKLKIQFIGEGVLSPSTEVEAAPQTYGSLDQAVSNESATIVSKEIK